MKCLNTHEFWKIVINFTMLVLTLSTLLVAYVDGSSPCGIKCMGDTTPYVLGYYWRDYFGSLPNDAFPGGLDEEGSTTFIGQVYIREYELLPGTLYPGCNKIRTSAYTSVLTPDKNIKILCSNVAYKLNWRATNQDDFSRMTCQLVNGGSEIGYYLYIGRTRYNGQTIIGKVFQDHPSIKGLAIPDSNRTFSQFEVLTYNC